VLDALATLLEYPESPLDASCERVRAAYPGMQPRAAVHLAAFAGAATELDLHELQELYTRTFDFDGDTALYVGHQLFAEDGRRGLFMAGMIDRYTRLGMSAAGELADHFAPVLRSLARDRDSEEAHELIAAAFLPALAKALPAVERRATMYGALLHAIALVLDEPACAVVSVGNYAWISFSSLSSRTSRS
jgi:nitrate reductase assembly molybdenum cofactor insertion protein NarJ